MRHSWRRYWQTSDYVICRCHISWVLRFRRPQIWDREDELRSERGKAWHTASSAWPPGREGGTDAWIKQTGLDKEGGVRVTDKLDSKSQYRRDGSQF